LKVKDTLPICLEYANNADPVESEIIDNVIIWLLTETLETGDSISIEFDAEVVSTGINVNKANLTAQECTEGKQYSNDMATVNAIEISETLNAEAGGPYNGKIGDTIYFTGSATGGKSPYSFNWDLGDGNTSDLQNPTHQYDDEGNYNIVLTVTDDNGNTDTDTASVSIQPENTKPNKPNRPTGESTGNYGEEYTYSTSTIDPDGDQIQYLWDWGDGTNSGWVGPYNSAEIMEISHTWEEEGSYEIKVMARDDEGLQSEWSDPLSISMPRNHIFNEILKIIIEKLIEKFPILEQILNFFPIIK